MRNLILIGATALAACASGEESNLSSIEGNAAETAQALADNVTGGGNASQPARNEIGPGPAIGGSSQWFERDNREGRWAGYGPPASEAAFSVRCQRGQLIFSTTEMPPSGAGATTMQVSAAGVEQSLAAEASEEGLPNTEAAVSADSQWLTRLASASGDLTVRVGSSDPLTVPISDPLTALIRDCRG